MTLPLAFDSSSSAAAGIYRQNAFYIRMTSLFDLEPQGDDPVPTAVSMHAHEYVHFLHNASTTAGQAYLNTNLILLRAIASGCDDQGYFLGLEKMSTEWQDYLRYIVTIMNVQLGTTSAKHLGDCNDISRWKFEYPKISTSEGASIATSTFSVQDENGASKNQEITIGLSFITEGVAYEIDREMRRLAGTLDKDLDVQVPIFPYLAYREALRSWSGRNLQTCDLIAIGITALSHLLPGFWLATICEKLRATGEKVRIVLEKTRECCRDISKNVLKELREQRSDLGEGEVIWTAIGEYMKLVEAGVQLRQKHWAPEFLFISKPLGTEEFRNIIGTMLDCLVIQGKPNDGFDIYWIGPGLVAKDKRTASCLGVLQAALHFSQLHLKTDGSAIATTALNGRSTRCPFSGGCQQEKNDQYPEACKASPWKRFTPSNPGEQVCWYAAGVKGLRNSANASDNDRS